MQYTTPPPLGKTNLHFNWSAWKQDLARRNLFDLRGVMSGLFGFMCQSQTFITRVYFNIDYIPRAVGISDCFGTVNSSFKAIVHFVQDVQYK
jgi:hypothetical protein